MKNKKERDFTCQHINKKQDKSIFIYHLINRDLCLCERCEKKLREEIFKQDKIEKEVKEAVKGTSLESDIDRKKKIHLASDGPNAFFSSFLKDRDKIIR